MPSDNSFTISPHNLARLHSTLLHSYPVPLRRNVERRRRNGWMINVAKWKVNLVVFFFLRMRPAAILLHGAAATNPRFPGTDWSGQWGSPKVVRAWYTLIGCGPPSVQGHRTGRLLRGGGPSGTCCHRNDRLQCGGGSRWLTLCEGDRLLVGCFCTREDGELCRLYRLLPIRFPLLH